MNVRMLLFTMMLVAPVIAAGDCPSSTTIDIKSSGYSGGFDVELRRGSRPGSLVVGSRNMHGAGRSVFNQICPGRYFFAFGTPDSDQVSVTRYFEITNDGYSYSNPEITVFYSRSTGDRSQLVGKSKRSDL